VLMKNLFIWWFVRDIAVWKDASRFLGVTLLIWLPFVGAAALVRLLETPQLAELVIGAGVWAAFFGAYVRFGALSAEQRKLISTLFPGRETKLLRSFGFVH